VDSGNIAWVLISTALVLFMTPGLAFFYGGMVRSKNFLAMLMQNYFAIGLLAILWVLFGASIAFGNLGDGGWLGNLNHIGFSGIGATNTLFGDFTQAGIPDSLFLTFQMTFAIITPALITGATADRLKFAGYAVFIGIWLILVYSPVAHWAFGGGWIAKMGAFDFAGGLVVHVNAGAAALAVLLVIGARKGHGREHMPPHALPWTLLGTAILWFGWFGFNAGSALGANGVAAQALLNTLVAPAAAMLGWLLLEKVKGKHVTTLGAASGAVAGMVAITPCAGFVATMAAIIIGFVAGGLCYLALAIKDLIRLDDALDVIAVHLVGGIFGSIALGLFADASVNGAIPDGLFLGGGAELVKDQIVATVAVFAFAFGVTFVIAKAIEMTIGLRVDEETEDIGLDQALHAETAYNNL
jgi:Amt family ammonium transporter